MIYQTAKQSCFYHKSLYGGRVTPKALFCSGFGPCKRSACKSQSSSLRSIQIRSDQTRTNGAFKDIDRACVRKKRRLFCSLKIVVFEVGFLINNSIFRDLIPVSNYVSFGSLSYTSGISISQTLKFFKLLILEPRVVPPPSPPRFLESNIVFLGGSKTWNSTECFSFGFLCEVV